MKPSSKFVFINAMKDQDREEWRDTDSRFRDGQGRRRYDDGRFAPMRSAYDAYDGEDRMTYEPESRFRDRRGREHYDNGRFAPMRSAGGDSPMSWHDPMGEYGAESRRAAYRSEGGDHMNLIGFDRGSEYNGGGRMEYEGNYRSEYEPPRMNEMQHRTLPRMLGHASGSSGNKLTQEKAKEWVRNMKNEDGTKGEHWSIDQVKRLLQQRGMEMDPLMVWVAMNAFYSDLCKVNERHGVNSPEYYLDAAVAFWLKDADAVSDKLSVYYDCIVKH